MKKLLLLSATFLMCILMPQVALSQSRNNDDEVVKLESYTRFSAVPYQLLVKFQDFSTIRLSKDNPTRFEDAQKSISSVNAVLDEYSIDRIEQLLLNFKIEKGILHSTPSYGGGEVWEHDLSQIYLITLDSNSVKGNYELIEALKTLEEVEFAEPNYICYALGTPAEETMVADATAVDKRQAPTKSGEAPTFSTNDPMYSMQWGFTATRLDSLLVQPKLDTTGDKKIIAIIDTGVDIDHPDLSANIWTNTSEENGANNQDDDNNGYADDVHGWDFVNQTGRMRDNNSHGTHCAGIAAAVGNNGIGVIGANPDALIMPVTVMQSDGTGDIATIVRGITYAAQNGADVISMSIGTYAYSIAMEQALAQAYQNCLLVAAAGNDATGIDPHCGPSVGPMFPGSFTFVIGVQATQQGGGLALFSNYDCDGPSYSQFGEEKLYNYEISAPGVGIMSTVPNGQYRSYNGTSMACPLVAGGLSALMERRHYVNKEVLFGDLINYNQEFHHINFMNMYNADSVSPAKLQVVAIEVNDTAYGDSSMTADAGEHIQFYPTLRTVWGPADSIEVWVETQEFEDTSIFTLLNNHVDFGRSLSSYAKNKSVTPIDMLIHSDVADGRHLLLTLCATCPNCTDTMRHDFVITITNGVKLGGMITHNDTLWPNVHYIVTRNIAILEGVTLVIKPGTTLKFQDGVALSCEGKLLAIGTPDSMITFTKTDLGQGWSGMILNLYDTLKYCICEYVFTTGSILSGREASIRTIRLPNNLVMIWYDATYCQNSVFRNNNGKFNYFSSNNCNFLYNSCGGSFGSIKNWYALGSTQIAYLGDTCAQNNNYVNNFGITSTLDLTKNDLSVFPIFANIFNNAEQDWLNGITIDLETHTTNVWNETINGSLYLGSAKESIVRQHISDFENPVISNTFGRIDLANMAKRPVAGAHGIVWKVEVQGFDSQDEFDSIMPLGPGTHEFKVYFNRAMDTSVTPMLAMGVRPPYTQTAIQDNAFWSADSTIWTAHLTLTGREAIDGINRIYVANAKDNEHFEIPYENKRFNVQVSSSGSMSAGFQATPGIGKVDLEWNDQEVNYDDFLGFNLYRFRYDSVVIPAHYDEYWNWINDTTVWMAIDSILLNQTLLQDTMYTDYDVVPGKRYYYYYKILSTSLTENSPSKTISAVPQSSIRGDANGSYVVDVADVIATINYMTNQNPQPFLFEASDVNADGTIDVLDVVGIINIILYGDNENKDSYEQQTAIYTVEDGILYVNSPVALAGLQFTLDDCNMNDIEVLEALNGFELINAPVGDGDLMLMAYSMSGVQVPAGKTALLRIGEKMLDNIVLSDPEGHNVIPLDGNMLGITDIITLPAQIIKAYPNPFKNEVNLTFEVGVSQNVMLEFSDMMGRMVAKHSVETPNPGKYTYTWNAGGLPKGIYFVTISINGAKAHTIKVVNCK